MHQIMDEKQETISSLKTMLHMILMLATFCEWQTTLGSQEASEIKLAFENPDFISIDCGATGDYDDEYLHMSFTSDKEFIDTGLNANISDEFVHVYNKQGQNLRYFPKGTRNCYTLNPKAGRNNKYLIRANFLYGNYDGKDKVPLFDLYLANDKWTTVDTKNSTTYQYYEIIYVPSSDYVDVCLHNTGSGIPFISALELRPLDNNIYNTTAGWLFVRYRLNIGASAYIRYPADTYDRVWESGNSYIINSRWYLRNSSSISNEINRNGYKLPVKISSAAITSENATTPFELSFPLEDDYKYAFYLHFAGIQKIQDGQQRELKFYHNDVFLGTVKLYYLQTGTLYTTKPIAVTGQKSIVSIRTADNSSLPPFLNAVEVFKLITINGLFSAPDDVNALKAIKKRYNLTIDSWQGDPCTPNDFLWEGLNCSYNETHRVVSINLRWSNLKGEIDPLFGNLSALESLDLSHNELSGQIPDFLADLPKLTNLNLTGNNLSGPIPKALQDKSGRGSLQLSLDENPSVCQSNVCPETATEEKNKTKKSLIVPVAASIVSVLVLLLFISAAIFWRKQRRSQEVPSALSIRREPFISKEQQFPYSQVVKITNNFNTLIGEGGFGKVYRGILDKETQVAVKMLSPSSKQGYKEFQAEAKYLLKVNHKNLVTLIGYCDEDDHKGFIYEYMEKGNLRKFLSDTKPTPNWRQRLQIAVDSAQGVHYLHNGCKETIIHRDMKTSNILLDENLRAKVADFGLSKAFNSEIETSVGSTSAGTPGYIDPEYHKTGNLSTKSDVHSFGVLLLEIITGRRAIMREASKNINIVDWTRNNFDESRNIKNIVDERLEGEFDHMSVRKAVELALSCVRETGEERPDMSRVLEDLNACLNMEMKVIERTSMELGDNATGLVEARSPNT